MTLASLLCNNQGMSTHAPRKHFATELRYLGSGTIETTNDDGTLTVNIDGMGRGKIAADMAFSTKRAALTFATVPQRAGWGDVAQLGSVTA